jgi:nicotinamidase-related amidase
MVAEENSRRLAAGHHEAGGFRMPHNNARNDARTLGTAGRDFYRVSPDVVDLSRAPREVRPVRIQASPQDVLIDLNKTALIVIDMQNDFCASNGWLSSLGADVSPTRKPITPIKSVAEGLRAQSVPVIWVNWGTRPDRLNLSPGTLYTFDHAGGGTGIGDLVHSAPADKGSRLLQKDSWGSAIVDELTPPRTDIFVDKHRISGFWDTPLDSILRNLAVRTLLFAGVNADECVLGTLMDANFHGYDTLLLEDCVGTTSPSYCMEATLYNVRFCFGFSLTSAALLASLQTSASTTTEATSEAGVSYT